MSIEKKLFGLYGCKEVFAYTLKNRNGAYVTILTYGGIMNRLYVPDREGKLSDIVAALTVLRTILPTVPAIPALLSEGMATGFPAAALN